MTPRLIIGIVMLLATLAATGCGGDDVVAVPGGDAGRGKMLIEAYGCGACHTISGVRGADAHIGPPLDDLAERVTIGGSLPNTLENLLTWLQRPQSVQPGTIMPDLGIGEVQARDLAAYLYSH